MVGGDGLVHPQPRAGDLGQRRGRGRLGPELGFEPGPVGAEQPRRDVRVQPRRGRFLRLGQEPFLEAELRLGGVLLGAVRHEDALAFAEQARRRHRPLRRRQQHDVLSGRGDRLRGQVFQRGVVGQVDAAGHGVLEVPHQVGLGPRRYPRLGDGDRLGHQVPGLLRGQRVRLRRVGVAARLLLLRRAGLRPAGLEPCLGPARSRAGCPAPFRASARRAASHPSRSRAGSAPGVRVPRMVTNSAHRSMLALRPRRGRGRTAGRAPTRSPAPRPAPRPAARPGACCQARSRALFPLARPGQRRR